MKDKIKVVSLQFLPKKADASANIKKIRDLLKNTNENTFDLILVPEFFNTGINLSNEEFRKYAESEDTSESLAAFREIAKEYNSYVVCGSFLLKKNSDIFNTSIVLSRSGDKIAEYSKIHLFNYFGGNEGAYTIAGNEVAVVDTDFGKLGLSICFDLRFASHFTALMKKGAEVITAPAAWSTVISVTPEFLENFMENWQLFARARALDNLAFVITSNNCGKVNSFLTSVGHSSIVDFNGRILKNAEYEENAAMVAQLDLSALREARRQFPITEID